jgi:hypothetical protein
MICRLCSAEAAPFGSALVLRRLNVEYFACPTCGLVQTENPYWLDEAYSEAIARTDTGIVSRNLDLIPKTQLVIRAFFNPAGRFVDYGAGTGLLVRSMRDTGYDFRYFDPYATNVFARGFEAENVGAAESPKVPAGAELVSARGSSAQVSSATPNVPPYDLLTAFEVFEHLPKPMQSVADMLARSKNILFTTELLPAHKPKPGDWWYYVLETGQHVSIYSRRTLEFIAQRAGLNLASYRSMHLLSQMPVAPWQFRLVLKSRLAQSFLCKRAPRPPAGRHALPQGARPDYDPTK